MKWMRMTGAWIVCVVLLFAGGQAQAEGVRGVALLQEVDLAERTVSLNDVKYRVGSFTTLEDENGRKLSFEQLPARLASASRGKQAGDELAVWFELGEKRRSGQRTLLLMRITEGGLPQ